MIVMMNNVATLAGSVRQVDRSLLLVPRQDPDLDAGLAQGHERLLHAFLEANKQCDISLTGSSHDIWLTVSGRDIVNNEKIIKCRRVKISIRWST